MASQMKHQDLANLRPRPADDEIDLGELIRNIASQWKLIATITFIGAVLGIVAALLMPKQYRVEAIIPQPKPENIEALLAQTHVSVSANGVMRELLISLNAFTNAEQAYSDSFATKLPEQSESERISAINRVSQSLSIQPQRYEFLGEDAPVQFAYVSVSLLSAERELAKAYVDRLVNLASEQTRAESVSRVQSAIRVELERTQREYNLVYREAEEALNSERTRLAQAVTIAQELGLDEPTSWTALIYGNANVQMLNPEAVTRDALFLKGTRFLKSQLAALEVEGAIRGFLPTKANELQAKMATLKNDIIDESDIVIVPENVQARIPASAEKPNRKLIAVASTVLSGFLGIFIALIIMALRNKKAPETATLTVSSAGRSTKPPSV